MWKFLGLEFFSIGEQCQVSNEGPRLDLLPEFLVYSLLCTAAFHILKLITDNIYHPTATKYARSETGFAQDKPNDSRFIEHVTKFKEEAWKWKVTLILTVYGISVILGSKTEGFDITQWHTRYPQFQTDSLQWYYRLSLGYHLHRSLSHFTSGPRRKDFVALIVHHCCTVFLIVISLLCRLMEVGVLVMVIHDNTDLFLALAKFLNYQRIRVLKDVAFGMFALSWIFCRCLAYSIFVLWPFLLAKHYSCHYLYYLIGVALFTLLVLHLYWLRMLVPMIISVFIKGGEIIDTRSDRDGNTGKRNLKKRE